MSSWTSYPSIFAMGHRLTEDLLQHEVNVEEKVDGSQFSFGLVEASAVDIFYPYEGTYPDEVGNLALKIRSKGCVMHIDAPEKMFNLAAETVKRLADQLHPCWTYRAEFLAKPHHNALAYDRVPKDNVIIFDVTVDDQGFLSYEDKVRESERLGLECVPLLFRGRIDSVDQFRRFLGTTSVLGGQSIEGVVVKPSNYDLYGLDKKVIMGKFVSEAFKEVHRKSWGADNPTSKDIITQVVAMYGTQVRWNKAIQHLREAGKLEDSPKDIGLLIREIPEDVFKECEEEIKDFIFKWAKQHIRRGLTSGFPQYYKELLLKRSFEHDDDLSDSSISAFLDEAGQD